MPNPEYTEQQIALHRRADSLDNAHSAVKALWADGSKTPVPDPKLVSAAYADIQRRVDAGEVELTARDTRLITSAKGEVALFSDAANFVQAKTGQKVNVADQIKNVDARNYGIDGEEPKILPLPQSPADVAALASLHKRVQDR